MAIPRTPVTIATSDTFSTWLSNTNYAVDILKNIVTDTVLTHASGAYTNGETVTQTTAFVLNHSGRVAQFTSSSTATFTIGEVINQATTSAAGVVTGASGAAISSGTDTGRVTFTTTSGTFSGNNTITGATSGATLSGTATYDSVFVAGRTLTGFVSGATAVVQASPAPSTSATTVSYTSSATFTGDDVVSMTSSSTAEFTIGEVISQVTSGATGVVTGKAGAAASSGTDRGYISYTTTSGTFSGNYQINGASSSAYLSGTGSYTDGELLTESTSVNIAILSTVGTSGGSVNAAGLVKTAGATTTNVVVTSGAFTTTNYVVGATSGVFHQPTAITVSHLATTNAVLTTPTITAPVIATITNNSNTLTLPTTGDTLVGRATTDTLTNKTLTSPVISGGSMSGLTITNNSVTSAPVLSVDNDGTIGSDGDADAMAISSGGVVTFTQRDIHSGGITIVNGGQIGSVGDGDSIVIATAGAVTFSQRDIHTLGITVANGTEIGSASDPNAITIASAGVVTFSQRDVHTLGITIANGTEIGSAGDPNAITISSGGVVAITATTANTVATDGALTVAGGLGVAGDATIGDDLRLKSDGSTLFFGADNEIELTHLHNDGLMIQNNSANTTTLWLRSSDTDIADGDILGEIKFRAPLEGAGSDAILTAASIAARSEGDFSDTNNATELVFKTGASEDAEIGAADGKMILSSAGKLDADNFACFFHYKFGSAGWSSGVTTGSHIIAGTAGNAYGNTTRFTSAFASDTLTVTFVKAGVYFALSEVSYAASSGSSASTLTRMWMILGGTATLVRTGIANNSSGDEDMILGIISEDAHDSNQGGHGTSIWTATAGQTATFAPEVEFNSSNAYSNLHYNVTIFG